MARHVDRGTDRIMAALLRCWSQDLEVQVHYEGIHRIDPVTGKRADVVDELQEAVVQCLDCMHDQPHLIFPQRPHRARRGPLGADGRRTPWVASCTVTVEAEGVETCSGPEAADSLAYAAFGDHGTREFFTHVRFHKHEEEQIVVHLLVELYARSSEEATGVLEEAARGCSRSRRSPRSRARRPRRAATTRTRAVVRGGYCPRRSRSGPEPRARESGSKAGAGAAR